MCATRRDSASAPASRTIDLPFIAARKRELIEASPTTASRGSRRFRSTTGTARFRFADAACGRRRCRARGQAFVIATGSSVAPPIFPGLPRPATSTATPRSSCETIPKSLIVLGGGYVACELGQFYSRAWASPTTMLIRSGHLLTDEDDDVGDALTEYFRDEGIAS